MGVSKVSSNSLCIHLPPPLSAIFVAPWCNERKLLTFDTFTFAVLNITTKYKCIFEK